MRLAPPEHRAYTYRVIVQPAEPAVDLDTFKLHIKKTSTAEDTILQMYLNAAITYAEKFTRRDFTYRTYETFRDFFPGSGQNEGYYSYGNVPSGSQVYSSGENIGYEIRKSPLVSVEEISYTDSEGNSGVVVLSSVYYNTREDDYSEILTLPGQSWPTNVMNRLQAIRIEFICGMADTTANFLLQHAELSVAIMEIATNLWANRGDCSECSCKNATPPQARMVLMQNRIENM